MVEALGRGAFIFHLSTLRIQSPKCSKGATYSKYLSTLQARFFNIMDLLGLARFFQRRLFTGYHYPFSNYYFLNHLATVIGVLCFPMRLVRIPNCSHTQLLCVDTYLSSSDIIL